MTDKVLRLGSKRYRVESEWAESDAKRYINNVTAVENDNDGYIYTSCREVTHSCSFSRWTENS